MRAYALRRAPAEPDERDPDLLRTARSRLSDRHREALMLVAWEELSGARAAREQEGETRFGDRRAHRLVGEAGEQRFEYLVDAESYRPLTLRWSLGELGFTSEFLVYERLPLDARSLSLHDLDPHPGASCAHAADDATQQDLGFPNPCG